MSEELPRRPSLAHLRKQAKELLKRLRAQNPQAPLSDALHALARGYGFPSWPKLKAHVESAAGRPPQMFGRFTAKARESLFFSRFEASAAGRLAIEPEDVLLGLIRAGTGLKGGLFERVPISLDAARVELAAVKAREPVPFTVAIPFSEPTKRAFLGAAEEADALRHEQIGLVHVLLGLIRETDTVVARVVADKGIGARELRAESAQLLNEEPI